MLPSTQDYKIALMIGADSFRTLENVEVVMNPLYPEEPWYSTGGLAIVFKIKLNGKAYALKCFHKESPERQFRLQRIASYIKQNPSPFWVEFDYLENELWVETNGEGQGYPVVLMEWIEGKTLDNYLEELCNTDETPFPEKNKTALKNLYFHFCSLSEWLIFAPVAHGDLKHDNIIVTPFGYLKLIDYDGMFIPEFKGLTATELGSPCYQHPNRTKEDFGDNLDEFSIVVILTTLYAFYYSPTLFTRYYTGDSLLFSQSDFDTRYEYEAIDLNITLSISSFFDYVKSNNFVSISKLVNEKSGNFPYITLFSSDGRKKNIYFSNTASYRAKPGQLVDEIFIDNLEICIVTDRIGQQHTKLILIEEKLSKSVSELFEDICNSHEVPEVSVFKKNYLNRFWFVLRNIKNDSYKLKYFLCYQDWLTWKEREYIQNSNFLLFNTKELKRYILKIISEYYPLSNDLIDEYKDVFDWEHLSENRNLCWSDELIEKFRNRWIWKILTRNKSLIWNEILIEKFKDNLIWEGPFSLSDRKDLSWSENLIERYYDKWDWKEMSNNESLPWSDRLVEKYKEKWIWNGKHSVEDLSTNKCLPWTEEFVEKYKDKWHWYILSANRHLPWSEELIEKYKDNWNWGWSFGLSSNPALPWSEGFIEKYKDRWIWKPPVMSGGLSTSNFLPWNEGILQKYSEYWDWKSLSINDSLPWSENLIEHYEKKWSWHHLSSNKKIPWSEDLIDKYYDRWNWSALSSNACIPWSIELIDKYKNNWDWTKLSRNIKLPWSYELLERFEEKWCWAGEFSLSWIPELPWSQDFIEKYEDRWNWQVLSRNRGIPWSIDLLVRFKDKWDLRKIFSENIYNVIIKGLDERGIGDLIEFLIRDR